jgi:hypothetical protein
VTGLPQRPAWARRAMTARRSRVPGRLWRRAALVALAALVLVPLGVPRVLPGDPGADAGVALARLCRAHGGTPAATQGGPVCTVRYGARTYRMDAITRRGFDDDTAAYQQRGCVVAQAAAPRPRSFIFHADTGVCEARRAH